MHISTNTSTHSLFDGLRGFFRSLGRSIELATTANSRVVEMDRLNAKSDADLSTMGLRREDIARHVFRDVFYI